MEKSNRLVGALIGPGSSVNGLRTRPSHAYGVLRIWRNFTVHPSEIVWQALRDRYGD